MNQAGTIISCTHCGDTCTTEIVHEHDHDFCCIACANVYGLLTQNGLANYYALNEAPGLRNNVDENGAYDFLNKAEIVDRLAEYREEGLVKVRLFLPQIHCSSCIFLLENLSKIRQEVKSVRVDFLKREASVFFEESEDFSLLTLFTLLSRIGYPPKITLQDIHKKERSQHIDRRLWYQIGLAGFVFGNVMLLSFPEYFGFVGAYKTFYLGYINLFLSIPLLVYGGRDYLQSAYVAIRQKSINIDVPLAIGILALFFRSTFEVVFGFGEGYFDSFAGLMFFLLIGKYVQRITYKTIDFDRNYKSYFPIGVLREREGRRDAITLDEIKSGDHLYIRNEELIPVDGRIVKGEAILDYSFVTGEADLVEKNSGEKVYAGAKLMGQPFVIEAEGAVDQSKLTRLWQEDTFHQTHREARHTRFLDIVGRWFTWMIIAVAGVTAIHWWWAEPSIILDAVTAILIVACPCAISMAPPFTYSNLMRLLGKENLYLKNAQTVETFQKVDHIVFDKTGTLTASSKFDVKYSGEFLSSHYLDVIRSLVSMSSHPLSFAIHHFLHENKDNLKADKFINHNGKGLQALFGDTFIRLGSASFIFSGNAYPGRNAESRVFVEINQKYLGYFEVNQFYRDDLNLLFEQLDTSGYKISILTGDSDRDDKRLRKMAGANVDIHYQQLPADKLNFIKNLQQHGEVVLMIGDGLNDAGALRQSDIGLVVSDQNNNFIPACDGVMEGNRLPKLKYYLDVLKNSKRLIFLAFAFAVCYNIIGLSLAVSGNLSPIHAAILMPLSSISIIGFAMLSTTLVYAIYAQKMKI